ncbi:peptidoglycan-binding protein LysM [Amylibacter marinus]|uniref:Peptidoglycan-binding protein LysM n=1 Tax=Amylibacter marinus TaxID=1475483 RepID=A0ABQ5VTI8_9RHOB|nr:peptidoglycan-binding protein LysM [Amylibacter marinus]GLQ34681.1 peptidoglycan-binding protein LysM [Amylibacter marinus]
MGLLNFAKNVGKKLFGEDDDEATATEALNTEIADLGLDAEGVEIAVQGDEVVLTGKPASKSIKEKLMLALGNVKGIAGVQDNSEDDSEGVFHTVESGDTLWAIAEKTMGNGAKYEEIFEANKPMLTHPDKIYPGQVLRIPT